MKKLLAPLIIFFSLSLYIKNFNEVNYLGKFADDALYYIGAKSIFETGKYMDISLYEPQKLTTFPPLYPLLITPAFILKNPVLGIRIINTIFILIALYFMFKSRFMNQISHILFYSIATNAFFILLTNAVMAESAFILLLYLFFYIFEKNENPVLGALLTGIIFYIKPYGMSLIPAVCVMYIYTKNYRYIPVYILLSLIFILPWFIYVKSDIRVSQFAMFIKLHELKSLSYLAYIAKNFWKYIISYIENGIFNYPLNNFPFRESVVLLLIVFIKNFLSSSINIQTLFFIFYTLLITFYAPFELRYIFPLIPLVYVYTFNGIKKTAVIPVALCTIIYNIYHLYNYVRYSRIPEIYSYIKDTPQNSIVFTPEPALTYVLTEKKCIPVGSFSFDRIFSDIQKMPHNYNYYLYLPDTKLLTEFTKNGAEKQNQFILANLNYKRMEFLFDGAHKFMKLIIKENDRMEFMELKTAIGLLGKNKLQDAKKILEKLYRRDSPFLGVYLMLSRINNYEKNFSELFKISEKALKFYMLQPEILYYNAKARKKLGLNYLEVLKKAREYAEKTGIKIDFNM